MSRILAKEQLPVRLLAGVFGILLLTYLGWRAGPAKLFENIITLGWGLTLVIALGGLAHFAKTWAWRLTLTDDKHRVSFLRMFGLRLASEAVGQLGALGQFFGETLRVSLMSPNMPLASGIASVTLDRAFFVLSAAVASIGGMGAVLLVLPLPHTLSLYAGLFAFILLALILVTAVAVRKRWAIFSGIARILGRIRYFRAWMERELSLIESVEKKLLDYYHLTPGAFWGSFALNLAGHAAAVLEVYLILWLLGAKISFFVALAIEALTKLVNIVGIFNPGNIGTYEGGNMLIGKMFGLSGATGLTLGLTRRLRAIFWAAVGGIWMVVLARSKKHSNSDSSPVTVQPPKQPMSLPEPQKKVELAGRSPISVVLANNLCDGVSFGLSLPQVGALPVLLRAILGAQRAGAARIVIVIDQVTGPSLKSDLLKSRRLPKFIEWFEVGGEMSLPTLLGQLVGEVEQNVVLIAGDRTYHPSLHLLAAEWNGEGDALALMTGNQLVGIYALAHDLALGLAKLCPPNLRILEELHDCLASAHAVHCETVQGEKWQRVLTPQKRLLAEQKLDRWLVKPTDGIFARMNRGVSVPISRQLIRFPITPNMVSLFTLGVSFMAGVCFAFGGYRNMLVGAILSVFASILDGCDGEVARLKLQESDFGCWLETICDYLYYLFIFVGMTIGLLRGSGTRTYLVWGGLLFFGAVASFLTIGLQRHQLTTGRPEQYLGIWQTQADSRRSSPLLYVGRHTEFSIRRCFLPYALLFFALFDITKVAFILSALGANVVWVIALYSYHTFAPVQASTVVSPAG